MNTWWRAYNEAVHDPKLQLLSDALFRAWFNVMCIASANDGNLPPLKDIAFTLRLQPPKAAQVLAQLHAAGLLDRTETGFAPHNWNGRQYKSDVSTERVKRFRQHKRNVSKAVSETPPETDTETDIAVADDARARPSSGSLTTPEALQLAEKLLVIAGHDPSFWPPGWCGAPMRVQTWLDQGWPAEIIVAATQSSAKRKHGAAASSVQFFEKAIAEEVARQSAPLPEVQIRPADKLTVTKNGQSGQISAACDSLIDRLNAGFGGTPPQEYPGGGTNEVDARLLAYGRG